MGLRVRRCLPEYSTPDSIRRITMPCTRAGVSAGFEINVARARRVNFIVSNARRSLPPLRVWEARLGIRSFSIAKSKISDPPKNHAQRLLACHLGKQRAGKLWKNEVFSVYFRHLDGGTKISGAVVSRRLANRVMTNSVTENKHFSKHEYLASLLTNQLSVGFRSRAGGFEMGFTHE
jgi:hypothetical protein